VHVLVKLLQWNNTVHVTCLTSTIYHSFVVINHLEGRAGRSGYRVTEGAKFLAPVQIVPSVNPVACKMGTTYLPEVKWPGRGVNHRRHLAR
jgi:hypothetical protein